jgi:hypothetical protein
VFAYDKKLSLTREKRKYPVPAVGVFDVTGLNTAKIELCELGDVKFERCRVWLYPNRRVVRELTRAPAVTDPIPVTAFEPRPDLSFHCVTGDPVMVLLSAASNHTKHPPRLGGEKLEYCWRPKLTPEAIV